MIRLQYINTQLSIGLVNFREAWLLEGEFPQKLYTEVYKGRLVFRMPGSFRRVSYQKIKKGLIKKEVFVKEEPLPF